MLVDFVMGGKRGEQNNNNNNNNKPEDLERKDYKKFI